MEKKALGLNAISVVLIISKNRLIEELPSNPQSYQHGYSYQGLSDTGCKNDVKNSRMVRPHSAEYCGLWQEPSAGAIQTQSGSNPKFTSRFSGATGFHTVPV